MAQCRVGATNGGRWAEQRCCTGVTELIGVRQKRGIEFTAIAGDWAVHGHKSHHTMNAMGHSIPDVLGVEQCGVEKPKGKMLACNMAMGRDGMSEHATRQAMNMLEGSPRTLPMASGESPFGLVEMGSMFTVLKVPDELACCDHSDPGCCKHLPAMWRALSVATPNSAARWLTRSPQAEVGTLVPAFGIEPVNPDFAVRVAGIRADA